MAKSPSTKQTKNWLKNVGPTTATQLRKITGLSIGPVGIQWSEPGPSERTVIRQFLIFLEDRRVLYNPELLEVESQVISSLQEIRKECTTALQKLDEKDFAINPIQVIQQVCRNFQNDSQLEFRHFMTYPRMNEPRAGFFTALGALRTTIGYQVALLATHYNLGIGENLSRVVPLFNKEDNEE